MYSLRFFFLLPFFAFFVPVYISQKATDSQKKQFITVLNSKRSNAINIGLTVLPQPETIKQAVLHMDSLVLTKENVEVKRKQEDGLVNTQVQDVFFSAKIRLVLIKLPGKLHRINCEFGYFPKKINISQRFVCEMEPDLLMDFIMTICYNNILASKFIKT